MFPFFDNLFDAFEADGDELFYVGGFVRDFLLDNKNPFVELVGGERFAEKLKAGKMDVDFATSAPPEKTIQILKSAGLVPIPIGIEFGTIQVLIDGLKVEITTYRSAESYKKGSRKPAVVFGKDLKEDLARRDFTVNAIAMERDGFIVDPFNGYDDLRVRTLDTPIDPEVSFSDDPLRMMRACRFEARGFVLSERAFKAMQTLAEKIKEVSVERVFEEMSKVLMSSQPADGLRLMAASGLLANTFPELQKVVDFKQNQGKWHSKLVWDHTLQVVENTPAILEVRWAALYHDVAKPQTYSETATGVHFYGHDYKGAQVWARVADRLKVSTDFKEHVCFLVGQHLTFAQFAAEGPNHVSDKALRRFAHQCDDRMEHLYLLSLADITSHRPDVVAQKVANCKAIKERITKLLEEVDVTKLKFPKGTGLVVAQGLGIKPGRDLGRIMKVLEEKLIDGEITLESDLLAEARKVQQNA